MFFPWYNQQHRHGGIGLMAPADVHYGRDQAITAARGRVLDAAYAANPERFVRNPPVPPMLADTVWINRPESDDKKEEPTQ
jgi:putative transposase